MAKKKTPSARILSIFSASAASELDAFRAAKQECSRRLLTPSAVPAASARALLAATSPVLEIVGVDVLQALKVTLA